MATDQLALFSRLSCLQPDDLDPLLDQFGGVPRRIGNDLGPCPTASALPQARLARADAIAVGVLIDHPLVDPADAAYRLGALAIEQDVEIIALSSLDYSGLERFGIRTERIAGHSAEERAHCRDQLMQFWGLEVILPT